MNLRVAILSGWHVHADGYAREFSEMPNVELTVMWDEDSNRGEAFARKFNMAFEPDLDALLARADVDAVCVTTPTAMHRDVMVKAARAGKHIFTEKVLTTTVREGMEVKAAIVESGVKFCISFPHRTMPHNLYAKQVADSGQLGDITLMRVRNAHSGASRGWLPEHFYDEALCGGGAMMDLGAHPMYLIRWLMGRPIAITSAFTSVTGHQVEDNAVSLMTFEKGAIAIAETGFVSEASPFMLELYGTKGSLLIGRGNEILRHTPQTDGWVAPEQLPEPLPGAIRQFVRGIMYDEPIYFGMDDALGLTEVMEAAYTAHRENRQVKL